MLVGREADAFREAGRRYKVTHIAIEPDYLMELGADANELERLPWLRVVYEGDRIRVLAIQDRDLSGLDRSGES